MLKLVQLPRNLAGKTSMINPDYVVELEPGGQSSVSSADLSFTTISLINNRKITVKMTVEEVAKLLKAEVVTVASVQKSTSF